MSKPKVSPTELEQPFAFNDLFFSTTDVRGVITSGNATFARVADYSLTDLIGDPHNIVRHPDMPRAVFQLLWRYLEQGKTIAAFVKNMARNGNYYWVMALAIPIPEGYLSIRFKPAGSLFNAAQSIYAQIREFERELELNGVPRKDIASKSLPRMVQALQAAGFPDYDSFMSSALAQALEECERGRSPRGDSGHPISSSHDLARYISEGEQVGTVLNQVFSNLGSFSGLESALAEKSQYIHALALTIQRLSLNTVVQARRLQHSGETLGVVAEELGRGSRLSQTTINELVQGMGQLAGSAKNANFDISVAKLLLDMLLEFSRECLSQSESTTATGSQLEQNNITILRALFSVFGGRMSQTLSSVIEGVTVVDHKIDQLRKHLTTLRCVQFSGRVEAQRVPQAAVFAGAFAEIFRQIEGAYTQLSEFERSIKLVQASKALYVTVNTSVSKLTQAAI